MRTILIILSVLIFSSCVTEKRCSRKFPPKTETIYRDSIVEREITVFVDTIIYVELPAKEIINTVYVPTPILFKSDTVFAVGDYSSAKAWVSNQRLRLKLNEGAKIKVDLERAIRETTFWKEKYRNKKQTITVEVNVLKYWQKALMFIGVIAIIFLAFKLYFRFK